MEPLHSGNAVPAKEIEVSREPQRNNATQQAKGFKGFFLAGFTVQKKIEPGFICEFF